VIPLLAELARAGREEAWPADEEGERALRLLEWPRVAAGIAGLCLSRRAAAAVTARRPYVATGPIALRRRLADELRAPGERGEWPPLLEISNVMDWIEGPRPLALEGPDLLQVAAAAVALDALADHFRRDPDAWPTWSGAAARQERLGHLAAAVRRACDRDGRLRDDATPVLGRLRRAARDQERAARAAAERALAQARATGLVTGDAVTLRGDRYCLPLRAGAHRRFAGIVHDRSATGGTLFVEPAAVVELHNALVETRLEMTSEEARILAELNRAVEAAAPMFSDAGGLLALADETRAALQWGARRRGSRPALDAGGSLRLCAARHPLLDPSAGGALAGGVVPLDLELPAGRRVLLVSGPNAGGKSVALKTVGVCVLLAQSGWDVPAREDSRLPLVRRLFIDLGDEQSIEHSLSSFSAHLGHLARFVDGAGDGALILCDEICSGTDPDEGAALALVVLETLASRGATVLATTHFGLLKAAVHEHPMMLNAAMDFDDRTLRPLFTLRMGVPGASHAFAIAARCGLPAELLEGARRRVGEERFQVERLLGELGERTRALAALEAGARAGAAAVGARERALAERLAALEQERAELLAATRRDGERLLKEGRRELEAAVREARGGDTGAARRARDTLRALDDRLQAAAPAPAPAGSAVALRPGDQVRIPHLGLTGRLVEVRGERVVAEARGLRLTLGVADVELLTAAGAPATGVLPDAVPAPAMAGGWAWRDGTPATQEIDLRGQRADEAWDRLDLLLDRAIPAGVPEILVVHGLGTGRLREALLERLAADPRVARTEPAPLGRGGAGATVVYLA
jgi:DNA mismatch repair protein MutS2